MGFLIFKHFYSWFGLTFYIPDFLRLNHENRDPKIRFKYLMPLNGVGEAAWEGFMLDGEENQDPIVHSGPISLNGCPLARRK